MISTIEKRFAGNKDTHCPTKTNIPMKEKRSLLCWDHEDYFLIKKLQHWFNSWLILWCSSKAQRTVYDNFTTKKILFLIWCMPNSLDTNACVSIEVIQKHLQISSAKLSKPSESRLFQLHVLPSPDSKALAAPFSVNF
jgi:hypothetical protein